MTSDPERDVGVGLLAAHILTQLDNIQEQLAAVRRTAEMIRRQQRESDERSDGDATDS